MSKALLLSASLLVSLLVIHGGVTHTAAGQELTFSKTYSNKLNIMSGFDFHWSVDTAQTTLSFAMVTPFTGGKGWVGMGIGEGNSGSMPGADMVIIQVDTTSSGSGNVQPTVGDYHADDFTTPVLDCTGNNEWGTAVSAWTSNSTHAAFELSRSLTVADTKYDRSIVLGLNPTKLMFAYGSTASMAYHGVAARALAPINLVPPFSPKLSLRNLDEVKASPRTLMKQWRSVNKTILAKETEYYFSPCVTSPNSNASGFAPYIIAFEPYATPGNEAYLHHMVAKGYTTSDCSGMASDILGLASRHTPFTFPEGVGLKMTDFNSFSVEIHYDNPQLTTGVVDSSGINVYYTYEPVEQEAGLLQLGDPLVQTPLSIANENYYSFDYGCGSQCTSQWAQPITVFSEFMHMHQTGYKMNVSFYDSDMTLKQEHRSDFYQFTLQQNEYLEPFTVNPGDTIKTTCTFKNRGSSAVKFGLDSDEEMCIDFLMYFPKQSALTGQYCGLLVCGTGPGLNIESSKWAFPQNFGGCDAPETLPPSVPTPTDGAEVAGRAASLLVLVTLLSVTFLVALF